MASLFEIPRSEVHLLDAGAGAGALWRAVSRRSQTRRMVAILPPGPLASNAATSDDVHPTAVGHRFFGAIIRTNRPEKSSTHS